MIVLDTHVLVWAISGDKKLGRKARARIDRSWAGAGVAVSAITFWELAVLQARGRLKLAAPVAELRMELAGSGLVELPLDGEAAVRAVELGGLPEDPADRLIVATAVAHGAALLSADEKILAWPHALERFDARV